MRKAQCQILHVDDVDVSFLSDSQLTTIVKAHDLGRIESLHLDRFFNSQLRTTMTITRPV